MSKNLIILLIIVNTMYFFLIKNLISICKFGTIIKEKQKEIEQIIKTLESNE